MPPLLLRVIALLSLFSVLSLSIPAPTSHAADTAFALKDAEKSIKKLAKAGNPMDLQHFHENKQSLDKLRSELGAYCEANPDDYEALGLMMDLYDVNQLYGIEIKPDESAAEQKRRYTEPYVRVADAALQRAPENPVLHYWRARLYGFSEPIYDEHGIDTTNTELPQAIREIRRAIELDPGDKDYREALGVYLALSGDEAGAMKEFQSLTDKHPVYILLNDWNRLQLPDELVFDPRMSSTLSEMMSGSGMPDAHWRVRSYDFTGSVDELEARWRASCPEFALVRGSTAAGHPQGDQVLLWKKDVMAPVAASAKDVKKYSDKMEFDGFLVSAMQFLADSTHVQKDPGLQAGGTYCTVMLMNCRKVKR